MRPTRQTDPCDYAETNKAHIQKHQALTAQRAKEAREIKIGMRVHTHKGIGRVTEINVHKEYGALATVALESGPVGKFTLAGLKRAPQIEAPAEGTVSVLREGDPLGEDGKRGKHARRRKPPNDGGHQP